MTKRLYTASHEWIEVEGQNGTVGITEYAQKELGEIVYIQLPKVGKALKAGEEACIVESTKAASDIYTPVSGIITAINEALLHAPQTINLKAETDGWLFKIELSTPSDLTSLLTREGYSQLVH